MEFKKTANFLEKTADDRDLPRFVPKKWIKVYNQSEKITMLNRIKTSMLSSDLCDFSYAYIVVKRTIIVTNPDNAKRNKIVAFKNNAPFINCILQPKVVSESITFGIKKWNKNGISKDCFLIH